MTRIFRKQPMEDAASPDRLDEYIKVSNLSVWLILGAAILLIAAALVWACFGTLTETQRGVLVVDGSTSTCYIAQSDASGLSTGDEVDVQGATGTIVNVAGDAVPASALPDGAADAAATDASAASGADGWYRAAAVSIDLPDGVYDASIVTESYSPIALLVGQGR